MEIKKYNEMMAHLTRPDTRSKEEARQSNCSTG